MVRLATAPRRHKHNAQKTIVDNITFASKAEARRYQELKLLLNAGEITDLILQPSFELQAKFTDRTGKRHRAIKYVADFLYKENGHAVVEEVKGHETPVWLLKQKLFLFRYEYELRIIG